MILNRIASEGYVGAEMKLAQKEYKSRHVWMGKVKEIKFDLVCLFGFYGISTFVGYVMPNQFLYK